MCALFDGTGAGGSWLACCSIYSQAGHLIGRAHAEDVFASGDKAQVSFGPFLRQGQGSSASGIQYDVENTGDWLSVTATGENPVASPAFDSGYSLAFKAADTQSPITGNGGILFLDSNVGVPTKGIRFKVDSDGSIVLDTAVGHAGVFASQGGITLRSPEAGGTIVERLDTAGHVNEQISLNSGTPDGQGPGVAIQAAGQTTGTLYFQTVEGGLTQFRLNSSALLGSKLIVRDLDNAFGGTSIFEVWDDGSIHGRAAVGAITWDLP